jgi:hypothetical protein
MVSPQVDAAPDAVDPRRLFHPLDQLDRRHRLAVHRHRHAALEADAQPPRRARRRPLLAESAARQHPRRLRDRFDAVERLAAADRHPPQAAVDRVGGAERRHRQAARLEIRHLLGARQRLVAHRRHDLHLRRQRAQRDLEAHLVVARRRAAVRHRARAHLARRRRHHLRLDEPLGADAQRIDLPRRTLPMIRKRSTRSKNSPRPSTRRCSTAPSLAARSASAAAAALSRPPVSTVTVTTGRPYASASQGTQKEVSSPPEKARTIGSLMAQLS